MQEAIEYLRKYNLLSAATILEDAFIEKEKQQIIKAHNHGYNNCEDGLVRWIAEDYYNETYGKE